MEAAGIEPAQDSRRHYELVVSELGADLHDCSATQLRIGGVDADVHRAAGSLRNAAGKWQHPAANAVELVRMPERDANDVAWQTSGVGLEHLGGPEVAV